MTSSLDGSQVDPRSVDSMLIRKGIPRLFDVTIGLIVLFVFSPLILIAAIAVAVSSAGPAIFRQTRVGLRGRTFVLYKLRTMRELGGGPQITSGDDHRVTSIGKILRKTKIDELPGLWNVVKGDMSLVGPRPEVPRYVDLNNPQWTTVLLARPGITDPITMRLRNEEQLLECVEGDREVFYLTVLQPLKLKGYIKYLKTRSCLRDLKVVWQTILAVILPSRLPSLEIEKVIAEGLGS